jgi:two-component system, NtrC family, response regulator AtoC
VNRFGDGEFDRDEKNGSFLPAKVHSMKLPKVKSRPQIGVLDADPRILEYIHGILVDRFNVSLFSDPVELSRRLKESAKFDLLLMNWHMDGEDDTGEKALDLVGSIRASRPSLPIVLMACSADLKDVVQATRRGATDVILMPFRKADIDLVVAECLAHASELSPEADDQVKEIPLDENTSLVLASKRMREIESQCRLVARADIPVLILGESGTGKEVVTMFIHKMSARGHRTFLKVNCAAMPADLLESELFGYEQGAFTGAVKSKPGKFEQCNGGTIFLDEIGEMPAALQAKLLQVLQDGSFSRLGGRSSVKVDVRVIAATNIDIKASIAQKTFREDLYYRLNGFTLRMPPLRDRIEEIPTLVQHFMRKVALKYEREPLPISSMLLKALSSQAWPGNLRELENTIKRYLILGDEQAIIDDLNSPQGAGAHEPAGDDAGSTAGLKHLVRNLKGNAESVAIAQALNGAGWNRKVAASDLQISYKALLYKIKQYNLNPPQRRQVAMVDSPAYDRSDRA